MPPDLATDGFAIFPAEPNRLIWAQHAWQAARQIVDDTAMRRKHLRHGGTWFVGVDALATGPRGEMETIPLDTALLASLPDLGPWPPAQLSVIFPGYPQQDPDQSPANHRFRQDRDAAHVDGLLPTGPERRRVALEYHAFILGVPLNDCAASPTVCWRGSHKIIGDALRDRIGARAPAEVDVTEAYQVARKDVLASCERVELRCRPGEAFLLHRHLLHGTAPWGKDTCDNGAMRAIAFFRPEFADPARWLQTD